MSRNIDIHPHEGEMPSQFAERVGNAYAAYSVQKDKRDKGQFFTPLAISQFMGSLAGTTDSDSIRILDPGCGSAILSCSLIEHLVEDNTTLKRIILDLYDYVISNPPYFVPKCKRVQEARYRCCMGNRSMACRYA